MQELFNSFRQNYNHLKNLRLGEFGLVNISNGTNKI